MAFEHGKLKVLIDELKEHNITLKSLVSSSERLAPSRARRNADLPPSWKATRQRALSLFNALTSSLDCDCRSSHYVNLQLPQLTEILKLDHCETAKQDTGFKLWFTSIESAQGRDALWKWLHAEVRTVIMKPIKLPSAPPLEMTEVLQVPECVRLKVENGDRPVKRRRLIQKRYISQS